ncbi:MAG: hypothetical protein U0892_22480 [Pirellulales bacterium]
MTHATSVFDELTFRRLGLEASANLRFGGLPSSAIQIPTADAGRTFSQAVPFFSRRSPIKASDALWSPFCGLMRELGMPLYALTPELESVPVASVPIRFTRRAADEGFDLLELETAEAIELTCRRNRPGVDQPLAQEDVEQVPTLPLELRSVDELNSLIEACRQLTDYRTPIGCALTPADVVTDVRAAIAAQFDFVLLEFPLNGKQGDIYDEQLLASVADAAAVIKSSPRSEVPLFVDADVTDSEALIILLAAGARAVSIDALIRQAIPAAPAASSVSYSSMGLLGSLGSSTPKPQADIGPIERVLKKLLDTLACRMMQTGARTMAEFDAGLLRGFSERAQQAARVPGLRG